MAHVLIPRHSICFTYTDLAFVAVVPYCLLAQLHTFLKFPLLILHAIRFRVFWVLILWRHSFSWELYSCELDSMLPLLLYVLLQGLLSEKILLWTDLLPAHYSNVEAWGGYFHLTGPWDAQTDGLT